MSLTHTGADSRRAQLLDEARDYRLASIARAGRRALRRAADDAVAQMASREARHDRYSPPTDGAASSGAATRSEAEGKVGGNRR